MHFKEINTKTRIYNYYFDYLIKAKTLENKTILTDRRNYKDLVIGFTRYDLGKSTRMLSLYYHELMGKIDNIKEKSI